MNKYFSNIFFQNFDAEFLDIQMVHLESLTCQGELGSSYLIFDDYCINIYTWVDDTEPIYTKWAVVGISAS